MKPEFSSVSIALLNYRNSGDTLKAIESLQNQREIIDEIYVLDNHSQDDSVERLSKETERFRFQLFENEKNTGYAGGYNRLFDEMLNRAPSEYFLVLNNDTEATPQLISTLIKEARPDRILSPMIFWLEDRETVIQSAGQFDLEMMKMDNLFAGKKKSEVPDGLHEVEQTDGCCFLIHRKWLEQGYRFDDRLFMYYEDVELFTRLKKEQGLKFFFYSDAVLFHKEYGSTGGREVPSAIRYYYFYRNRIEMTRRLHSIPKRWRIYWRIYRLAQQKKQEYSQTYPEIARAIQRGIWDGLKGQLGRKDGI